MRLWRLPVVVFVLVVLAILLVLKCRMAQRTEPVENKDVYDREDLNDY